ncbi:MAG TPA: FUSC family protein [Anaerolineales bacterium]
MSMSATGTTKYLFGTARQELAAWGKAEIQNWVFALKVCLATLLAMGLSMQLQLDQPRTAMITVFVVMQPHTGMILAKSLYRIGATMAGTLASLLLVSLFAQERVLFVAGLALWIGLCTAGAAFYRNFRSYGFVLAGYTAAMIGLPAAQQPDAFFPIAVTRLSEVTLGILCAGVVSDVIFPRRLSDAIVGNVQNRYTDFIAFIRASLSGAAGSRVLEKMQLRLVSHAITLESIRTAAVLEDPEVRARDLRLRKLNSEFMAASTTFHSFHQLLKRLTKSQAPAGLALTTLYESLGATLVSGEVPRSAVDARRAIRRIAATRVLLSRRVTELHQTLSVAADPQTMLDFETAVELLFRFLRELHAYTRTYATLPEKLPGPKPPDDIRFAVHTDPLVALLSGGRAFAAILLTGTFWVVSAWPYGISALMNAAIVSALFAAAPDPPRAVRQMVTGFTCGFLVALMFKFLVMPSLDGFAQLGASMAPLLVAGAFLATRPKLVGVGTGFLIFFSYIVSPGNPMQFNPVDAANDGIATIMGIAAAGVMFGIFIPTTGLWLKRRVMRQLRNQVVRACFDRLDGLAYRFESCIRDVLHKLAAGQVRDAQDRLLLAWMFSVAEIGRAAIHLRQDARAFRLPQLLADSVQESISSIASLFSHPSAHLRCAALDRVASTIEALRVEAASPAQIGTSRDVLRRMLTSLHLIRTALLDEDAVLATTVTGRSVSNRGGSLHAP